MRIRGYGFIFEENEGEGLAGGETFSVWKSDDVYELYNDLK